MQTLTQLRTQAYFSLLEFRRNPAATFFTVLLPLFFLVLFPSIFGNETVTDSAGNSTRLATYYVPGILALALVSAAFVGIAINLTFKRELGILKRLRGSPLRPWIFVAAGTLAILVVVAVMTVLVIFIGWILFDVDFRFEATLSLILTLILSTFAFNALAFAVTTIITSETAAPAITNMFVLPLYFISDVFIPAGEDFPQVLRVIGDVFPIKHVAQALYESFDPFATGAPFPWQHWLVVAGWGVFGFAVATWRFRWHPRRR